MSGALLKNFSHIGPRLVGILDFDFQCFKMRKILRPLFCASDNQQQFRDESSSPRNYRVRRNCENARDPIFRHRKFAHQFLSKCEWWHEETSLLPVSRARHSPRKCPHLKEKWALIVFPIFPHPILTVLWGDLSSKKLGKPPRELLSTRKKNYVVCSL